MHSAADVVAVMCTVKNAPAARSAGPQVSACDGLVPVTEHGKLAPVWLSIDQVTPVPVPAGSGSLTVTPLAVPAPVLVTVTVNPIGSPAFTDAASAVLVIVMFAGWQVILASAEPPPSLDEVAVAVLS